MASRRAPHAPSRWSSRPRARRPSTPHYRIADYLRHHVDGDAVVGVHWAGITPYFSDLRAVDVLGKADRHIARLEVPGFRPAHSKWDWDYLMTVKRPDVMIGASRGLGARADFQAAYRRVRAGPPWDCELFVRAESLGKLHDPSAVVSEIR
jgi:hypothetical protein